MKPIPVSVSTVEAAAPPPPASHLQVSKFSVEERREPLTRSLIFPQKVIKIRQIIISKCCFADFQMEERRPTSSFSPKKPSRITNSFPRKFGKRVNGVRRKFGQRLSSS